MEGYKNLRYLNSMAYLEGFYYHPRIDKQLLKDHSKGLIGLSACLGGEVAQTLMREGYEKAKDKALEYKSMFEEDTSSSRSSPTGSPSRSRSTTPGADGARDRPRPRRHRRLPLRASATTGSRTRS